MTALRPLERVLLGLIALVTALAGLANYARWADVPRFVIEPARRVFSLYG